MFWCIWEQNTFPQLLTSVKTEQSEQMNVYSLLQCLMFGFKAEFSISGTGCFVQKCSLSVVVNFSPFVFRSTCYQNPILWNAVSCLENSTYTLTTLMKLAGFSSG